MPAFNSTNHQNDKQPESSSETAQEQVESSGEATLASLQRVLDKSQRLSPGTILRLQTTVGNQAVNRLLAKTKVPTASAHPQLQRTIMAENGEAYDEETALQIVASFKKSGYYLQQLVPLYGKEEVDNALTGILTGDEIKIPAQHDMVLGFDLEENHSIMAAAVRSQCQVKNPPNMESLHSSATGMLDAIRNPAKEFGRGLKDERASLSSELDALLWQISASKDTVDATLTKDQAEYTKSKWGFGQNFSPTHTVDFATTNENYRYIRFVKAAKLREDNLSCTQQGYVRFVDASKVAKKIRIDAIKGNGTSRQELRGLVKKALDETAQWSYDGPNAAHELKTVSGQRQNIDEPGESILEWRHIPYILVTQFVGVLYDPTSHQILNVTRYDDVVTEFGDTYPEPAGKTTVDGVLKKLKLTAVPQPITETVITDILSIKNKESKELAMAWLGRTPEYPLEKWTQQAWSRYLDWSTSGN